MKLNINETSQRLKLHYTESTLNKLKDKKILKQTLDLKLLKNLDIPKQFLHEVPHFEIHYNPSQNYTELSLEKKIPTITLGYEAMNFMQNTEFSIEKNIAYIQKNNFEEITKILDVYKSQDLLF